VVKDVLRDWCVAMDDVQSFRLASPSSFYPTLLIVRTVRSTRGNS
jgi:hypothetical protein